MSIPNSFNKHKWRFSVRSSKQKPTTQTTPFNKVYNKVTLKEMVKFCTSFTFFLPKDKMKTREML